MKIKNRSLQHPILFLSNFSPMKKKCILLFYLLPLFLLPISQAQDIIYVNAALTTGNGDGTSWANAYTDLNQALFAAGYGDQVWVATGTYRPGIPSFPNRSTFFALGNGVQLYGGFTGTETELDQRDWALNSTVLSGDIGVPGDSTDNCYTVVYCSGADSTTVLDGFTVTGGNSDGTSTSNFSTQRSGGGMYIEGESGLDLAAPRVKNCTFSHNYAARYGGGVLVRSRPGAEAVANFTNCQFEENTGWSGGGIELYGSNNQSPAYIEDCTFKNNNGFLLGGGGVSFSGGFGSNDVYFKKCYFFDNIGVNVGGGIKAELYSQDVDVILEDCTFRVSEEKGMMMPEGCFIAGDALGTNNRVTIDRTFFYVEGDQSSQLMTLTYTDKVEINNCKFIGSGHILENTPLRLGVISSVKLNNVEVSGLHYLGNMDRGAVDFTLVSDVQIINSVLVDLENEVGPIIRCTNVANLNISNSILYGNKPGTSQGGQDFPEIYYDDLNDPHSLSLSHCLINADTCNSPLFTNATNLTCGPGMLYNVDPMFADTTTGDYHLGPCSPARNAGDNAVANQSGLLTDLDGNQRIEEGTVDMSPYETPPFGVFLTSVTDAKCNGESSGTATIDEQSGCTPFSLSYGGASTFTDSLPFVLEGLPAGTFEVTVNDSEGRSEVLQVSIGQPPQLTVSPTATTVDCGVGTFGTATATAGGGTPFSGNSYLFEWTGGQTGDSVGNLSAGNYAVTATDSLGCTATGTFSVAAVGQLSVGVDTTGISCHPADGESSDGSAAATSNGVPPYVWAWQDGQMGQTIEMLGAGSYSVTVTDALGCSGTTTTTLLFPDSIGLTVEATPIVCQGLADASASANAGGGTMPYSYQWATGETTTEISGIGSGTYTVTLTDANGCQTVSGVEILENTTVQIDTLVGHPTGPTAMDGTITVQNVNGGTPPYSFSWDTGDTTASIENLPVGTYSLTLTDSLGCTQVFTFVLDFEVAASEAGTDEFNITVYPNPAGKSQLITCALKKEFNSNAEYYLLDAWGRKIREKQKINLNNGAFNFTAPSSPGIYWLIIEDGTGRKIYGHFIAQ